MTYILHINSNGTKQDTEIHNYWVWKVDQYFNLDSKWRLFAKKPFQNSEEKRGIGGNLGDIELVTGWWLSGGVKEFAFQNILFFGIEH